MPLIFFFLTSLAFAVDGGQRVSGGYFKSVIKIGLQGGRAHCTGTLISPKIVLTAAHCIDRDQTVSYAGDLRGKLYYVWKREFTVESAFQHPTYAKLNEQLSQDPGNLELIKKRSGYDLAFLVLDEPQDIQEDDLGTIGCESIPAKKQVVVIGFGKNVVDGRELNFNYELMFGLNKSESIDEISRKNGNLVNSGDSGGPMFLKSDLRKVYAVASAKLHQHEVSFRNFFTPTSSAQSLELFRMIQSSPIAPPELKALTKTCLDTRKLSDLRKE